MLVVPVNRWMSPQGIFTIAGLVMAAGAALALLLLTERHDARAAAERPLVRPDDRSPARVAALRGLAAGA